MRSTHAVADALAESDEEDEWAYSSQPNWPNPNELESDDLVCVLTSQYGLIWDWESALVFIWVRTAKGCQVLFEYPNEF